MGEGNGRLKNITCEGPGTVGSCTDGRMKGKETGGAGAMTGSA